MDCGRDSTRWTDLMLPGEGIKACWTLGGFCCEGWACACAALIFVLATARAGRAKPLNAKLIVLDMREACGAVFSAELEVGKVSDTLPFTSPDFGDVLPLTTFVLNSGFCRGVDLLGSRYNDRGPGPSHFFFETPC